MTQFLRAYAERAAEGGGEMGSPIRFVASTENVARDGMVIPAEAWQLDNFRKNPVVLFSHDYFSRPPIGKVTNISVDDGRLMADVVFDADDDFAVSIERKVRNGIMSACSVGWDTLSFEPPNGPNVAPRVTKADLLDFSVVPVPSDPDALKVRQQRGLATMARDILKAVDPENGNQYAGPTVNIGDVKYFTPENPTAPTPSPSSDAARATWEETAPDMVRLFSPFAQRPDQERHKEYQRLAREYARHGKTPPEELSQSQIDTLGPDEIRGLFLENEPDLFPGVFEAMATRAGAVLSKRNRDDLDRAIDLIQGVLARTQKEAQAAGDEQDDDERSLVASWQAAFDKLGAVA